jgi:hypothetical protein
MANPLSRYASSPSRGTTPTAWQSQFRGVCALIALVREVPHSLES